ncbi:MAG: DNA repair protein RecO, partial [Candidatus Korobacteraceae bacterium]
RIEGKVKGVARAAKKSKRRFGGALEPMTLVRAYYDDREGKELARLDSCDIIDSPLSHELDYSRVVALEHIAETLDELLPEREANDDLFRLTYSVLRCLEAGPIWIPLTYFQLWLVRLIGFLPELDECVVCGESLAGSRAFYHALADGLMCLPHKRLASSELTLESRELARRMFRAPVETFAGLSSDNGNGLEAAEDISHATKRTLGGAPAYADLRKFLVRIVERHLEKKLVTATMLERL